MVSRLVTEDEVLPVLREIDSAFIKREITSDETDDLIHAVTWIVGKTHSESNIQHVVTTLRSYKEIMDSKFVSHIIKQVVKALG
jgi:hypothetical protein